MSSYCVFVFSSRDLEKMILSYIAHLFVFGDFLPSKENSNSDNADFDKLLHVAKLLQTKEKCQNNIYIIVLCHLSRYD